MKSILLSVLTCSVFLPSAFSQHERACIIPGASANAYVMGISESAGPLPDVIIIPVVVHVLYNSPAQNISDVQVKSQIAVLNNDFRRKNDDAANIPAAFRQLAADTRIEFRLATIDPSGLPTTGIIRKTTSVAAFGANNAIKSELTGGSSAWDRNKYLNIWIGNLSEGVMGFASLPGCTAETDGVVIRFNVFGTTGTVQHPHNKGRTAVHEIGHWLGLRHIWGDAACGDDKIEDTPPQQAPTRGCPSGILSTCTSGPSGNMYMNFMDFTNDECTNMFTHGQAARMRELFRQEGARAGLLVSNGAEGAVEDDTATSTSKFEFIVFPNPAVGELNVRFAADQHVPGKFLVVYNHLGLVARKLQVTGTNTRVSLAGIPAGLYFISDGKRSVKFTKQ